MSNPITDVSFDLETLGVDPGCVVTQIGACAFNMADEERKLFNVFIDPQSCLDLGCTIRWSTISWWLQQPAEARAAMCTPTTKTLNQALDELSSWFVYLGDPMNINVWGHGATFDISILEDVYRRVGRRAPWFYRNVRDLRTLRALAPEGTSFDAPDSQTGTVKHVAADDAAEQARWIVTATKAIRK